MKRYRVMIMPEAEAGIREGFAYIAERSVPHAELWLQQLYAAVDSLEHSPERCMRARECEYLEEDLRQLAHKSHRIVFQVNHPLQTVFVLLVRHSRMRSLGEPDED